MDAYRDVMMLPYLNKIYSYKIIILSFLVFQESRKLSSTQVKNNYSTFFFDALFVIYFYSFRFIFSLL